MLYSFELQMMGAIFSIAMIAGGISLWVKRRKIRKELESSNDAIAENDNAKNPYA
jgi:prolipoprotein diacylglyceryltransferase